MTLTVGSLFSGIGGFDLGLERAGMHVEWQVENNEFCRQVLKKHWPSTPCHYDITQIDWRDIPRVDLICGGFPCQPFSVAGKRGGKADDRYLWPEVVRCLDALRPTWFLGENVPGLINLALDQVCIDMESLGYAVWPVCVPACAVDAPHRRERVWIIAYHQCERGTRGSEAAIQGKPALERRENGRRVTHFSRVPAISQPVLCRVGYGLSGSLDRLRGLGNAVVPQVVEAIGRMILEADKCNDTRF